MPSKKSLIFFLKKFAQLNFMPTFGITNRNKTKKTKQWKSQSN